MSDLDSCTTEQFLSRLRALDVRLSVEGDRLRYSAPPGALSDELRAELARRKPDVLAWLKRVRIDEPPIVRVERNGPAPLSLFQERQYYLSQLKPDSAAYNINLPPMWLQGPLDEELLERCFETLARRHETLRTSFVLVDGEPRQRIHEHIEWQLPVIDLSTLPEERQQAEGLKIVAAEAAAPFDLARTPLWRGVLVRVAEDAHVLLFTIHHIISDGWSLGLVSRELTQLYEAGAGVASLPELPVQYADFAAWQRSWLRGPALDQLVAYWRGQLESVPVLRLPTDFERPAEQTFPGAIEPFEIPRQASEAIRVLGNDESSGAFPVLLTALAILLSRASGQDSFAIGTYVANRNRPEVEDLIGFFINNLALTCDLSGAPTCRELLARMRDTTLGAYAHQDLPFEQLLQELQVPRDPGHTPVFQVMFVFHNFPQAPLALSGTSTHTWVTPQSGQATRANFDLTLWMWQAGETFQGYVDYNTDLFRSDTVRALLAGFGELLAVFGAGPDKPVADLPVPELGTSSAAQRTPPSEAGEATPMIDVDTRRERIAARRAELTPAQRALLQRRLGGGGRSAH
jgi:hypothetical protein